MTHARRLFSINHPAMPRSKSIGSYPCMRSYLTSVCTLMVPSATRPLFGKRYSA